MIKKFICALICLCLIATNSSAETLAFREKVLAAFSFVSACFFAVVSFRAARKLGQQQLAATWLFDMVRMLVATDAANAPERQALTFYRATDIVDVPPAQTTDDDEPQHVPVANFRANLDELRARMDRLNAATAEIMNLAGLPNN